MNPDHRHSKKEFSSSQKNNQKIMTTDLFIISGRSGSGKTTALKTLEDNGYKCLDNFPVNLLGMLIEKNLKRSDSKSTAYAVCADSRSESIELYRRFSKHQASEVNVTLIYLDAQSPTLVKRFSETRGNILSLVRRSIFAKQSI